MSHPYPTMPSTITQSPGRPNGMSTRPAMALTSSRSTAVKSVMPSSYAGRRGRAIRTHAARVAPSSGVRLITARAVAG